MKKLVVLFPGIGYTCDKPLLYYADDLAANAGYERIKVSYVLPGDKKIRGNLEKMEEAFRILYARAEECLADVDWSEYEEVVFVSKSIGTVIASAYAKTIGDVPLRHVLYTPLKYTFDQKPKNAIGFLGSADLWSSAEEVLAMAKELDVPMYLYENANHSLETGDTLHDLDTLKDVMEKTKQVF